jgi:hypothetical protein
VRERFLVSGLCVVELVLVDLDLANLPAFHEGRYLGKGGAED